MNRFLFIFLSFSLFTKSFSQTNLVPNWSFEDIISCPQIQGTTFYSYTPPWFSPTENTPDIYNSCASPINQGVPYNYVGYQQPHTGNGYAGFSREQQDDVDYLSVKLISPLKAGKKYCISFYVNPGNYTYYVIDAIGAYISVDSIHESNYSVLPFTPQIENPLGNIISDTVNWTEISGIYIANGGERFITVGSFFPDSIIHYVYNDTIHPPGASPYYYLDDVSVYYCGGDTTGINNYGGGKGYFNLYPDPTNDEAYLDYQLTEGQNGKVMLFNITGQLLAEFALSNESNKLTINTSKYKSGIYFYKVIVNNNVIENEKLIILK